MNKIITISNELVSLYENPNFKYVAIGGIVCLVIHEVINNNCKLEANIETPNNYKCSVCLQSN